MYYDNAYTTGYFANPFFDANGDRIAPVHRYCNNDDYSKQSHELRVSSPRDERLRSLLGVFWQQQKPGGRLPHLQNWIFEPCEARILEP